MHASEHGCPVEPKGQRPLLLKSEGDGYMLSAFVSRELGFGRTLTDNELVRINSKRQIGKTYTNTQAATKILKTINKPLLTESPFVKYLFVGANNEGYWNSFHMSLQFEGCGLSGRRSERQWSTKCFSHNVKQRGSTIGHEKFNNIERRWISGSPFTSFVCWQYSVIVYKNEDSGPFYLSPEQRELHRHDKPTGKHKLVERSKKLLINFLKNAGVLLQQQ